MIRLRTLGGLGLTPEPATGTPQPRRLAILARLAVAGDAGVSRDVLVGQLWPDTEEARARHALTQALYGLRRDLGGAIVVQGTGFIRLNPAVLGSDVADFRAALKAGDRRSAVEAYAGEFLPGFYVRDAGEFERWVDETRSSLAREYRQALEMLAAEGDAIAQLPWLERLSAADPLDSRYALRLAQARATTGSPAVALRSLQAHQSLVAHELGAPVGKEVADLIKRLESEAVTQRNEVRPVHLPPAAGQPGQAVPMPDRPPAPATRPQRRGRVVAGFLVLAGVAALFARALAGGGQAVDAEKYVVIPFRNSAASSEGLLSGANCARLVSAMLEGWRDVRRVDPLRVASTIAQSGEPADLEAMLALARSLGAGRIIWGDVNVVGDSLRVRGAVFDASRRNADPLREASFSIPLELLDQQAALTRALGIKFGALTRDLMVPGSSTVPGEAMGTVYVAALEEKLRGDSALAQWDLPAATEAYRAALAIDAAYPQANLSLAQAEQWTGTDSDKWRAHVITAMVDTNRLSAPSRVQARALRALADGDYPAACGVYRGMIARDSADFVAWYGLAECLSGDKMVVADSGSPSGYSFRSSHRRALEAYERALKLVPLTSSAFGGAALMRLVERTMSEANVMRMGFVNGDEASVMLAFPTWSGDSLAFVPYPAAITLNQLQVPGQREALAGGRRTLLRITNAWIAALPNSAPALEAQATALELAYPIIGPMADSALKLLRRARLGDPRSTRLRFQMVRVMLKGGDLAGVVALADSVVEDTSRMSTEDLALAAILAALRGKRDLAADLQEQTADSKLMTGTGEEVEAGLPVSRLAQRLLVYAAFGEPEDSIRSLERAIMKATASIQDTLTRGLVRVAAIERPRFLAFPLLGAPRDLGHAYAVENALFRGDRAAAAEELERLRTGRRPDLDFLPADAALLEGRLWLMSGDSAAAASILNAFRAGLPSSGLNLLPRVEHAAAIRRLDGEFTPQGPSSRMTPPWRKQ